MNIIDFHAHILPGADHGSEHVNTSLFQLARAERAQVSTIVATPHFYPQRHSAADFLARRENSANELKAAYNGNINVVLGAEVLLCEGLVHLAQLPQLCIEGTNVLLIEMPMTSWTRRHTDALAQLRDQGGFTVVLAHVDRYLAQHVENILEQGFLGQVNAESLCRLFNRKKLRSWVSSGKIVALGSDVHGKSNAYGKFSRACRILGEEKQILMEKTERLICTTSGAIQL